MSTITVGRVRPVVQGAWNPALPYVYLDVVSHQGSSYIAASPEVPAGAILADPEYWTQLASKGDAGDDGIDGINGTNGTNGAKGDKGDTGNTGATPPTGPIIASVTTAVKDDLGLSLVPLGTVIMLHSNTPDPGYLIWNEGGNWTRGMYPQFDALMDVRYAAYGMTQSMVAAGQKPDFRDYVPRTAGGTLGPAIGAKQEDALQEHNHTVYGGAQALGNGDKPAQGGITTAQLIPTSGVNVGRSLAAETRVKSFGVRWQIKAYGSVINQGTADLVSIIQANELLSNNTIRKDIDQNAQSLSSALKINIGKNSLRAWEQIGPIVQGFGMANFIWNNLGEFEKLRLTGFLVPGSIGPIAVSISNNSGATWKTDYFRSATVQKGAALSVFNSVTDPYAYLNGIENISTAFMCNFAMEITGWNSGAYATRMDTLLHFAASSDGIPMIARSIIFEGGSATVSNTIRIGSTTTISGAHILLEGQRG